MFRGKAVCVVIGLALVTAWAQIASAQPRGRRGGGFGMSSVMLATLDQVQSDLKMTDEQKSKAVEVEDELSAGRRELFQQGPANMAEAQEKMEKLNADAAGKLSSLLDKDQLKRLAGISIQVGGPMALNDPIVVGQLNLSDEQKTKLHDIRVEHWRAMGDVFSQGENMSREERREKMDQLRDEAGKKLMAVLTPGEQTQFEQLKGEPIDIELPEFGGGRRGG